MKTPNIGDRVTCAETGKAFIVARDGCSVNYAMDAEGHIYSDEGVDRRERRALLDRTQPFVCYVSSDGRHVTGWKGNILGDAEQLGTVKLTRQSFVHGTTINSYRVTDVHGGKWYGRGSPGIAITLRPSKR